MRAAATTACRQDLEPAPIRLPIARQQSVQIVRAVDQLCARLVLRQQLPCRFAQCLARLERAMSGAFALAIDDLGSHADLLLGRQGDRLFIRSELPRHAGPGEGLHGVDLAAAPRDPAGAVSFGKRVGEGTSQAVERIAQVPGVQTVAGGSGLPPQTAQRGTGFSVAGRTPDEAEQNGAYWLGITPNYFATLNTRVLKGREFQPTDAAGSAPVVIINEELARALFGETDPLGRQMQLTNALENENWSRGD